ncbi:AraC family transcriptional regulator [uncultured Aquimarina sp.]|uniref:AraC family transcriptional regulator n=1 Tax=uncultured Aquimarina sp. TaxID=575652 RepID=UPI00261CAEAC|nr:AraC family transcriptional regulator [uncultured Aquimarina sp.]
MIFLLFITAVGYAQNITIPDSLQTKTFDEIEGLIYKHLKDSIKVTSLSKILLAKGKLEQDSLGLTMGYFQVSFNHLDDLPKQLAYLDSSIAVNSAVKHPLYPLVTHINRAAVYKQFGNYILALDDYLTALNLSEKEDSTAFNDIKHSIGTLKLEFGEYEDAKKMYKEIIKHENENGIKGEDHLKTVLGLANSYRKLKQFDSASYYTQIGLEKSIKDSLDIYYQFVLNAGVNLYANKQYESSLYSINKAIPHIEKIDALNTAPLIDGYLYLGKIYMALGNQEIALKSLEKIDWYFENDTFRSEEMREGYELLINYYKSIDDKNKQLYYINRVFAVDSVLNANYRNLHKTITNKYDTPQLLEEKQRLITTLQKKEKTASVKYSIAILLVIILTIFFAFVYYRKVQYKKRYQAIMHPKNKSETKTIIEKSSVNTKNNIEADTKTIDIPENIIKEILEKLTQFEDKNRFLARNLTITALAKKLNTNSKYLSKIINHYKQKRFSVYINELRIDYVIKQLKENPKFKLYSIKAIARELGYNNDRAFSKAFYQKTGMYPSYFIKLLEKENNI